MDTLYLCQEETGQEGSASTAGPRRQNIVSSLYEIYTKEIIDLFSLYALRISSQ